MSPQQSEAIYQVGASPSATRLRAALRANVVFSFACGILFLSTGWFIDHAWGLGPSWLVPLIGAGLLPFAAVVSLIAALPAHQLRVRAQFILLADAGWVIGTLVVLKIADIRNVGVEALLSVSAVVFVITVWEAAGIASVKVQDPLVDFEVVESSRFINASPERVWPVVTDHDLYGRLAPNLSKVEVLSEPGEELRRHCVNTSGDGWDETCTIWEENRRYAIQIDTTNYPYPIKQMFGLWQVDPHNEGSRVTMRFIYQVRPSLRGGLFAIVYGVAFPFVIGRIFRGWREHVDSSKAQQLQ